MKLKINPHYQQGTEEKIAFIFSCPGREEEKQARPGGKNNREKSEYTDEYIK